MTEPINPQDETTNSKQRRFRRIPVRAALPSILTLLAICAGLTSIRMGVEGRYEMAVGLILLAAVLDGLDGRVARLLKSTSKFGAELDSLADFVNFGVAPALLVYTWKINTLGSLGWVIAMVFAISAVLRLARFNVALEDPNQPAWQKDFFVGVPAPAGALIVLLPLYLENFGIIDLTISAPIVAAFTVFVAWLLVSRLPTWSGKSWGQYISSDNFLIITIVAVFILGMIISYPFTMLTVMMIGYLMTLPLATLHWRKLKTQNATD